MGNAAPVPSKKIPERGGRSGGGALDLSPVKKRVKKGSPVKRITNDDDDDYNNEGRGVLSGREGVLAGWCL